MQVLSQCYLQSLVSIVRYSLLMSTAYCTRIEVMRKHEIQKKSTQNIFEAFGKYIRNANAISTLYQARCHTGAPIVLLNIDCTSQKLWTCTINIFENIVSHLLWKGRLPVGAQHNCTGLVSSKGSCLENRLPIHFGFWTTSFKILACLRYFEDHSAVCYNEAGVGAEWRPSPRRTA